MPRPSDLVHLARLDAHVNEDTNAAAYTKLDENGSFSIWKRDRKLGQGGFGAVYCEKCTEGRDQGKLRAVKIIQKQHAGKLDYSKELEAIARFSQPKVLCALHVPGSTS
jgi:hypothetical protein